LVLDDGVNSLHWPDFPFPINYLRAAAITFVRTRYVLFTEADMLPNGAMRSQFDRVRQKLELNPKSLFVTPAFLTEDKNMSDINFDLSLWPQKKADIKEKQWGIHPVPYWSHEAVPYHQWLNSNEFLSLYKTTSAQEPYFIGHRDYPVFDEIFIGCGKDKIGHVSELERKGYRMEVAPESFLVHLDSTGMGSPWCQKVDEGINNFKMMELGIRSSYEAQHPPDPVSPWWDFNKLFTVTQLAIDTQKENEKLALRIKIMKGREIDTQLKVNKLNEQLANMYQSMQAIFALVLAFFFVLMCILMRRRKSAKHN